jgi:hypothetical protein
VGVIALPPHCMHLPQPVDFAWAKPFKDRFSTLVVPKWIRA